MRGFVERNAKNWGEAWGCLELRDPQRSHALNRLLTKSAREMHRAPQRNIFRFRHHLRRSLLNNLELEVEFLAAEDRREIELPEFSGETKRRPALVEIHKELQTYSPPQVSQADVRRYRLQLCRCVERERSASWNEAGERIAVEMVPMSGVGRPVGVRIVRRDYFQSAAGLRDAMEFSYKAEYIGNVLDHMTANNLVELVIIKRIRKDTEVVNDVGVTARVRVDADGAGKLILTTPDVQYSSWSRSGEIAVAH